MSKISKTQQRVLDAMADGKTLRYFPPSFNCGGFFRVGADPRMMAPPVPYTTIPAMVKKGLLVEVRRFDADATSSGRNAAIEYRRAPSTATPLSQTDDR